MTVATCSSEGHNKGAYISLRLFLEPIATSIVTLPRPRNTICRSRQQICNDRHTQLRLATSFAHIRTDNSHKHIIKVNRALQRQLEVRQACVIEVELEIMPTLKEAPTSSRNASCYRLQQVARTKFGSMVVLGCQMTLPVVDIRLTLWLI